MFSRTPFLAFFSLPFNFLKKLNIGILSWLVPFEALQYSALKDSKHTSKMSINVTSIFSLLESQIGRPALSAAMLAYLSVAPSPSPAPAVETPVKAVAEPSAPPAPFKAKKEWKPSETQVAWNNFLTEVRSAVKTLPEANMSGKVVMRVAKDLRDAGLMGTATAEQIVAAYTARLEHLDEPSSGFSKGHTKAGKKAKADASSMDSSTTAASSVAKALDFSAPTSVAAPAAEAKKRQGRKKLADMTDEERAAHNAKKAAKRASKTPPLPLSPKASADDELLDFTAFNWNSLSLLRNPRGDCLTEDMEWFGHWDAKAKKVDTTAAQPSDLNL